MRQSNYWQRRITRRRWIQGTVIGGTGLAAAALVGCGDDDEVSPSSGNDTTPAPSPTEQPKQGGTITLPIAGGYGHFSPNHGGGEPQVVSHHWSGLFTDVLQGPDAPMIPVIGTTFEFPDPQTLVVSGLRGSFHDRAPANGRAITSKDVVATIDQRLNDKTAHASGYWKTVVDFPATETPNDSSVVFHFRHPQSPFSYSVGGGISIQPVEALEMHARGVKTWEQMSLEGVSGSGGWTLDRHVDGSIVELVRHGRHALAPRPFIERVRLVVMPDSAAQEAAFRSGEIDGFNPGNVVTFQGLLDDLGDRVVAHTRPSQGPLMLKANVARPPFQDERARRAATRAIDRDKIIKAVYFGKGDKFGPGFTQYYGGHHLPMDDPETKALVDEYLRYDPEEAKSLVDALIADGTYDGEPFELLIQSGESDSEASAPLVKQMLDAVGLRVNIVQLPKAEYNPRVGEKGQFDVVIQGAHPSLDRFVRTYHTDSNILWEHFALNDPETDRRIEEWESAIVSDYEEFVGASHELQKFLMTTWPTQIPIAGGQDLRLFASRVKGYDDAKAFSYGRWDVQEQMWLRDA